MPKYSLYDICKFIGELWKIVDISNDDNEILYKIRMVTRYETEYVSQVDAFLPVECFPTEERWLFEENIVLLDASELCQILFGT
jgi:hypothetical protein